MIAVDSSVWIDYFRRTSTRQVDVLDRAFDREQIVVPDLVWVEVLQGFDNETAYRRARELLGLGTSLTVVDDEVATLAIAHHRYLRRIGVTTRRTIDTLIATRCILDGIPLLYADRDYDPFVQHLGLRSAMDLPTGAD